MTKEEIGDYTKRISQANASGYVVILYELILAHMDEALQTTDPQTFENSLQKAQSFLQELMHMSKMDSKVTLDVMSIYLFVDKQLLMSIVKREPVNLPECKSYLERLKKSFEELAKKDTDEPIMEKSQAVYAGLTYGRGYLNESMDPLGSANRGFQA